MLNKRRNQKRRKGKWVRTARACQA